MPTASCASTAAKHTPSLSARSRGRKDLTYLFIYFKTKHEMSSTAWKKRWQPTARVPRGAAREGGGRTAPSHVAPHKTPVFKQSDNFHGRASLSVVVQGPVCAVADFSPIWASALYWRRR